MYLTKKGFTLVEISIVLIVIGLLIGGSAKLYNTFAKKAKQIQSANYIDEVRDMIEGFAYTFKRLPTWSELDKITVRKKDAWGKDIIYIVDGPLTKSDRLCQAVETEIMLNDQVETIEAIAYVIISSGKNRNRQTGLSSQTVQTAAPMQEIDLFKQDIDRIEPYDDIVIARSLFSLKKVALCQ